MDAELFFDLPTLNSLDEAAALFFDAVGVREYEERESTFYIDCRYFRAIAGGVQYMVAISDDVDAGDLRFWLLIDSIERSIDVSTFNIFVDQLALTALKDRGARVVR